MRIDFLIVGLLSRRTLKTCSERFVEKNGEYAHALRGGGREPVGSGSEEMVENGDHHSSEESPPESFDSNYNTFSLAQVHTYIQNRSFSFQIK
jgi:hypothetical protein